MDSYSSEEFECYVLADGRGSEQARAQISMKEGVKLTRPGSRSLITSYGLDQISDVALEGTSLKLHLGSQQVQLSGSREAMEGFHNTLLPVLLQWQEMQEASQSDQHAAAASRSSQQQQQQQQLPAAAEVEFWNSPDKEGWLYSQGDVLKTWRKRWHVLKAGHLFRFLDKAAVGSQTVPRGITDLSKIVHIGTHDTKSGTTPNSIMLTSSTGAITVYKTDSETEQVEWLSAFEGALNKLLRTVAGVDSPAASAPPQQTRTAGWEAKMSAPPPSTRSQGPTGGEGGRHAGPGSHPPPRGGPGPPTSFSHGYPHMVDVISYSALGGTGGSQQGGAPPFSAPGGRDHLGSMTAGAAPRLESSYGTPSQSPAPGYSDFQMGGGGAGGGYPSNGAGPGQVQVVDYSFAAPSQHHQSQPSGGQGQRAPSPGQASPAYPAAYSGSLLDATPTAQPAYGSVAVVQADSGPALHAQQFGGGGGWSVHQSPDGRTYYFNGATGQTSWDPPAGM